MSLIILDLCTSIVDHCPSFSSFFFFNDTATTEIYTLSLHDALPIYHDGAAASRAVSAAARAARLGLAERRQRARAARRHVRSEEHTSELQSLTNLVCRLLLEKKKKIYMNVPPMSNTTAHDRTSLPNP